MFTDFILNGAGHGAVGEGLMQTGHGAVRFDTGMLRPYVDERGRHCVDINTGRVTINQKTGRPEPVKEKWLISDLQRRGINSPVFNATTLRKDEWIEWDRVVIRAARQRLRAWADLAAANSFGGFNGMAKLTLEYEAQSDPGEAIVDMEGITPGRTDSPLFKLRSIPLPITHSDFWFSERRLAVSRNSGTPLDTTMAEACGRRVAEMIEKTVIGVEAGAGFGTNTNDHDGLSKVYGYTNFPQRITKTDLTTPTGTNPEAVKQDVIEMREALYAQGFYGPFMLYHTPAYDAYFDDDYFRTGATTGAMSRTLRERIGGIEGVAGIRRLDYWTGSTYQMVMVQMTSDVARAIIGMPMTIVQWESIGGLKHNWKVMTIQVPQLRSDYSGKAGVLHATTS